MTISCIYQTISLGHVRFPHSDRLLASMVRIFPFLVSIHAYTSQKKPPFLKSASLCIRNYIYDPRNCLKLIRSTIWPISGHINDLVMKDCESNREPMCETSEKGERLFCRDEMVPITLEIGRRIMKTFGYQKIPKMVFRLRSNSAEIDSVINGQTLPSTELLLGIYKVTMESIDGC